jgi:hypothetical protein
MPTYIAELEVHAEERSLGEWKETLVSAVNETSPDAARVQEVGAGGSPRSDHVKLLLNVVADTENDAARLVNQVETQLRTQHELRQTRPWLIQGPAAT